LGNREVGGEVGQTVGAGERGGKPNAASQMIEQIIRDKRTVAPWTTEEQLARYTDAMLAQLDRAARGKAANRRARARLSVFGRRREVVSPDALLHCASGPRQPAVRGAWKTPAGRLEVWLLFP